MSEDKKTVQTIDVKDLEKDLSTKLAIKEQIENALQQTVGQITCLRALIKKAKGIVEKKEEPKK